MNNFQTYYIPGYPGSNSNTAKSLAVSNPSIVILEYDPEHPDAGIDSMLEKINSIDAHPIIIASSLGGWYAEQLAKRVPCDLILWNPSLQPQLNKYGIKTQYDPVISVTNSCPRTIFLGAEDDVVNPEIAASIYEGEARVEMLHCIAHRMTEAGLQLILKSIGAHQCFPSNNI